MDTHTNGKVTVEPAGLVQLVHHHVSERALAPNWAVLHTLSPLKLTVSFLSTLTHVQQGPVHLRSIPTLNQYGSTRENIDTVSGEVHGAFTTLSMHAGLCSWLLVYPFDPKIHSLEAAIFWHWTRCPLPDVTPDHASTPRRSDFTGRVCTGGAPLVMLLMIFMSLVGVWHGVSEVEVCPFFLESEEKKIILKVWHMEHQ